MTSPRDRVAAFIARRERVKPGCQVVWSDPGDGAVSLRLDDLKALLGPERTVTDQPPFAPELVDATPPPEHPPPPHRS